MWGLCSLPSPRRTQQGTLSQGHRSHCPSSRSLARNPRPLQPATSRAAAYEVPGPHSTQPSPYQALLAAPRLCPHRSPRKAFPKHTETCPVPSSGPRCPHARPRLLPVVHMLRHSGLPTARHSAACVSPAGQDKGLHHRAPGPGTHLTPGNHRPPSDQLLWEPLGPTTCPKASPSSLELTVSW